MPCNPVLGNYLINKILLVATNQGTWTSPANLYAALFTSNPNPDNSGTEVTGGSYARQPITWAAVGSGETTSNSVQISFPTATGNWGAITYIAIFDAVTSGNLYMFAPATVVNTVTSGSTYIIPVGQITMSLQ